MTVKLIRKDFNMAPTVENQFYIGRYDCQIIRGGFEEYTVLNEVYQVPDDKICIDKGSNDADAYAGTYEAPPNFPCIYFYKNNLYALDRNKYSKMKPQ
jgi:hypothetical protein